ncbi:MAG: methyltransferase domain-containing protein [Verrucomicrobia bacterium]|nr:methyltransferase domain-containing protein [Verrucomicrobiota bacterium]
MHREVQPELLDHLPASAPWAIRSRADLRRLNRIMGNAGILTKAFSEHLDFDTIRERSLRICELGAGDGSLLLELARSWSALGVTAEAECIDLRYLVTEETRHAFVELNWHATPVTLDVMTWLDHTEEVADVILANLFLHHFEDAALRELLDRAAARCSLFIACEPRRSFFALAAAHLLWAIGCNPVTRHDAAVSVRAGFTGKELSALWPERDSWLLREGRAGLFSHCFVAKRYA